MGDVETSALPDCHAACPVCGGGYAIVHVNAHARFIGGCARCGHHFVINPWSNAEVAGFYQGFEYFDKNCNHQGISGIERDDEWSHWVEYRLGKLDSLLFAHLDPGPVRILELGCLEGRVLNALARRGHHVVGCDLNEEVAKAASARFDIDIRVGDLENCGLKPGFFDAAISFHTLEHIADPIRTLSIQKALVRPGGIVFFEIPMNETDYENKDHLHFFSMKSLELVLKALFGGYAIDASVFRTGGGALIESVLVTAFRK